VSGECWTVAVRESAVAGRERGGGELGRARAEGEGTRGAGPVPLTGGGSRGARVAGSARPRAVRVRDW